MEESSDKPTAPHTNLLLSCLIAGFLAQGAFAQVPAAVPGKGAGDEALALPGSEPDGPAHVAGQTGVPGPWRVAVEVASGAAGGRPGVQEFSLTRASVDLRWTQRVGDHWRLSMSDRFDRQHPTDPDRAAALNSLREAYASWTSADAATAIDFGRINLRHGQAYAYSPTDVFRIGSLRSVVAINPVTQRESRMGTVMLRMQQFAGTSTFGLAYAPKLADGPNVATWSGDFGATNQRHRLLGTWSQRWTDRLSTQALLKAEQGSGAMFGLSGSGVVSDSLVAFAEWTASRERDMLATTLGDKTAPRRFGQRLSTGVTWSAARSLNITVEMDHNAFALLSGKFGDLSAAAPTAAGAYLLTSERSQDIAGRSAMLVYLTRTGWFGGALDATALLRRNIGDHSYLAWGELRWHVHSADFALQLQLNQGESGTQYGTLPARHAVQIAVGYRF